MNDGRIARELRYWWRAALVSTLVTGVEVALVPLLTKVIPAWTTFLLVQVLSNIVTFLVYKYWAFGARRGSMGVQYGKQLFVFGGSWTLNTLIPSLFHYHFHMKPVYAFALSNVFVYLGWNYPLNRIWVFHRAVDDGKGAPLSSRDGARERRQEG